MPEVSIIIVTWNGRELALQCLDSIQRYYKQLSKEIIVVDNRSTDGTSECIAQQFPSVRLIQNESNLGFARANNIGINASSGRYVCLMNSDVVVTNDSLAALVEYMDENASVGLVGPKMLGPTGVVRRSTMRCPTVWNSFCRAAALDSLIPNSKILGGFLARDFTHDRTCDVEVLNGWFWLVRRSALSQVGCLDERFFIYGEDLDWCRRFLIAGWRVVFHAGVAAIHYGGASSAISPLKFYIEMQRANLQYWEKHHGPAGRLWYWLISCVHHIVRITGFSTVFLFAASQRSVASLKIRRSMLSLRWLGGLRGGAC